MITDGVPQLTFKDPFLPAGTGAVSKQGVRGIPLNSRKDAWAYDQQWNLTLENDLGDGWATRLFLCGLQGHQLALSEQPADSHPQHHSLRRADRQVPLGPELLLRRPA